MKKSVGSLIALNRNLIIVLAVLLGAAASGVIAWQVNAGPKGSASEQLRKEMSREERESLRVSPVDGLRAQQAVRPQDNPRGMYRGVKTADRFDVSPPLRTLIGKGFPAHEEKERTEFEDLPTGLEGPLGVQDIDPTVQGALGDGPNVMPTPIVSFDSTIGCGGCAPPDPNGDVGPNHFVAMGNSQFQVFSKTGTSLLGPANINTLWAGFGGACQTRNDGDPVVIYDQLDDRWILTQFTSAAPFFNCVAISTSPDPTGTYFRYAFSTGNNFPDYPKFGMWNDALYISTREFAGGSGGPFAGVGAYAVNRAQLVAGNPAAQLISLLASPASAGGAFNVGDGLVPTDLDGAQLPPVGSPNYFIGSMDQGGPYSAPQDALVLWKFIADFATPANSTFTLANTIPVAPIDTIPAFCGGTRACIPQQGTTHMVDHLGYRQRPLFRAAYRNFGSHQSIVTNQSVEASPTMSGIRWWEIRSPNSSPVLFQDATYAPGLTDGIHRWMGGIAMDTVGNIALGYSASSSTIFPSVNYTGRLASDPINTMPQGEAQIKVGTGSQTSLNRWGDYSDMVVDPLDDCTFWYTSEYVPVTSATGWRLRIGSFKFPNCSLGPNFSLAVTPASQEICAPANAVYTVNTTSISGFTDPIVLSATGNPAGTVVTFSPNPVTPGNSSTMTVSSTAAAAAGTYTINAKGISGALMQNQDVTLRLFTAAPGSATLTAPANASTGVSLSPAFTWTAATQAKTYTLEVATDAAFTNIVHTGTGITGTSYSGAVLSSDTQYFWRVRAVNTCGTGSNSAVFSFRTSLICTSTVSYTGPPVAIPDNIPAGVNINIPVTGVGAVTDLNFQFDTAGACDATLGNVNAAMDHTFIGDLTFKLTPPDGSPTVSFQARRGGTRENICLSLLDDEGGFPNISTLTSVTGSPQAGNFSPETTGRLSLLDGETADGTWVLNVSDNAGIDTGFMRRFSMIFNTGGTTCGGTPTATATASPSTSPSTSTPTATATSTATATPTGSPSCNTTTVSYTGPAVTLPDNVPAGVNINLPVAGVGSVTDLNFRFDPAAGATCDGTVGDVDCGVTHSWVGDLVFKLTPPDGSPTVTFFDRPGVPLSTVGCSNNNLGLLTLNDDGGFPSIETQGNPSGTACNTALFFVEGSFSPNNPLSALDGENANGTWVLNVSDNAGIDTGSVRRFSLVFNEGGTCGTGTPTATATATATPTSGGTPPATSVQFGSATYTEDESQTAAVNVTRTGDTTGTTTVNFATSNGTATGGASCTSGVDYLSVAQAVTFNAGETAKTVNVQLCSDALTEPTQTVNMTLTGAGVGSPATAVLSIIDTASLYRSTGSICTTFGGPAAPYPATIAVSNGPASIGSMRVTLFDVTGTIPDSMDFLLVGPGGQKFILMADAGGVIDLTNPVTLTFSDAAGQVVPNNGPLTTGVFEPTSWEPGQTSFIAPAPPAPYNEPGSTVGGTGTQTLVGNFGSTNSNGTWSLYMRDDAGALVNAITACVNGGWGLEFLGATAANASVSGRVTTADGRGIRNANVVITGNSLSSPIVATTGSFGYFTFDGLATGETYVVTVNSQRYTFAAPSRVLSLIDNVVDADFVADSQ
jgi:subtilisin-like proprotein convertase family protein